ncbi:hypothetical protein R1flu_015979 [Riccia fluitans]|uniref:BI1-like protein n=1 Tax=Riccia fluitans TaxID=41844 RepID=A0ABD1YKI1_9MARC
MSYAKYQDLEAGMGGLYPGQQDQMLRWGFMRKVYGILSAQIILTAVVASVIVLSDPLREFFTSNLNLPLAVVIALIPLFLTRPLASYHQSYPLNLLLLGLFTVALSLSVGIICALTPGIIVLEALFLTATVVMGLTVYTFYAAYRGLDFEYLGPSLIVSLTVLLIFGFIQMFFPFGNIGSAIYGGIGALIFSLYIVFDTDNLIKRYDLDEYILASVALYLDIINLFVSILRVLWSNN